MPRDAFVLLNPSEENDAKRFGRTRAQRRQLRLQRVLSKQLHALLWRRLDDRLSPAGRARVTSLSSSGAAAAIQCSSDVSSQRIQKKEFSALARFRLGVHYGPTAAEPPICNAHPGIVCDGDGIHAHNCNYLHLWVVRRHDKVKHAVGSVLSLLQRLELVIEKKPLGCTKRPDIRFQPRDEDPHGGTEWWLDTSVIHAPCPTYTRQGTGDGNGKGKGVAARIRDEEKLKAYKDDLEAKGVDEFSFYALSIESYGRFSSRFVQFVDHVGDIAEAQGFDKSAFKRLLKRRVAVALYRGNAELLMRARTLLPKAEFEARGRCRCCHPAAAG